MPTIEEYYETHLKQLPNLETRIAQLMHDYSQGATLHDVRVCEDKTMKTGQWSIKIAEIRYIIKQSATEASK